MRYEGGKQDLFKDKMTKQCKWNLDEDVDKMWNKMANCMKRVAKEIWGI